MKKKILTYEGEEITITYDVKRCIHAENCIHGLPDVFAKGRRPWINADGAGGEEAADVIETCPTGALQYEMRKSDRVEQPPSKNQIIMQKNGPVYMFGDIEIQDHEGNTVLKDTRFALCRCGASKNKPACDNSHLDIEFSAGTNADPSKLPGPAEGGHGKLVVKLMKNGPAILAGTYTVESETMESKTSDKGVALCRCGASDTKPFCDGSHKDEGFKG